MHSIFRFIVSNPKTVIAIFLLAALAGFKTIRTLPVDVFPDISMPRVTIQTEAGGLTADEVEMLVTIPIEAAVNGVPGVQKVRSSSSGGLSFVWVDFDWNADLTRARFDVFERLARVKESLPEEAHAEISPLVSVTGEIMLIALTAKDASISELEIREIAEYDLRTRLLGVPGIGEVAVIGARLPEFRVAADPIKAAERGLSLSEIIDAARSSRTYLSAGYLQNFESEEVPINQLARADTLAALRNVPIPLATGSSLKLGEVAEISVQGEPRRGSASFNGKDAVVLSVQKAPGGNTPELTKLLEKALADFSLSQEARGINIHTQAYRQADFIAKSIEGGGNVVRDAAMIVVIVLLVTLLEIRTILIVLCTMPLSVLAGLLLFPALGLGVNVMTLGGFAVAAGDIVDAAIIFTEVIRRKLAENNALSPAARKPVPAVIAAAAHSVAPSVMFSALTVVAVFVPLLLLSGLEGKFFRPLALSYVSVFAASLLCALGVVPALALLLRPGCRNKKQSAPTNKASLPIGVRLMHLVYRPLLALALKFPKTVLLATLCATAAAIHVASSFGSSFLPPFREDSYNVMLSLPPGASLAETERIGEAAVPALQKIPGVLSVTRRTGRAERDQHAEPVSSSEFVVRVDLDSDTEAIKRRIREELGSIPGAALVVGYPIAHRISAILSGSEAELAINVYGEDLPRLRKTAEKIKSRLDTTEGITDVRANREITVRTLRIDYDLEALAEAGITLKEAGEQVSAALNGIVTGEVRNGMRRRSVTVRLAGDEMKYDDQTVSSLIISSRNGKRVRLDEIAAIIPIEASNLLLREGSRRKILITANPAPGANIGDLVKKLEASLSPIAAAEGAAIEFSGSYVAKESAEKSLAYTGMGLAAFLFMLLLLALGSAKAATIALVNVPLGLIGAVAAVAFSGRVLSVSSLVGLVTVTGFLVRNGILLLNAYRERLMAGESAIEAIRNGSEERMVPIVLTSATTVIGLIPIILSGSKPGGELLAPLAVVQFGGLIGATALNLIVLPAAAKAFGIGAEQNRTKANGATLALLPMLLALFAGCKAYEPAAAIDWEKKAKLETPQITLGEPKDAAALALVGNLRLNALRLKAAGSANVVKETGWWEDPEFGFDLMRILQPAENPFLGGAGLSFTLPLSGVKKAEKKAAAAYQQAQVEAIEAAEKELTVEAEKAALALYFNGEKLKLLKAYEQDAGVTRATESAKRLCDAGEYTVIELNGIKRRAHDRKHTRIELETERSEIENTLRAVAGLHPKTAISLSFSLPPPDLNAHLPPPDLLALTAHPAVKAACARLKHSEAELEAEIRKQYPELTIGPLVGNEEGKDRAGITAGITLPLWNRNRRAIAQSTAARDEQRLEVVNVWRELALDASAAHTRIVKLLDHPPAPAEEADYAERLLEAGEITPLEYLAAREEMLARKLEEIAWRAEVAAAKAQASKFTVEKF